MNLLLVVCLLTFLVFIVAVCFGPQRDDLRGREMHHAYLGVALALIGLAFDWRALAWAGVAILADDSVQHAAQRWWLGPQSRLSLLHRLYGKTLYRWAWVRRLNEWLDRRLT